MRLSRIAPLVAPYEPEVLEQLQAMMPPGVAPILLFRTFAKNLPMTRAMRGWGSYELGRSCRCPCVTGRSSSTARVLAAVASTSGASMSPSSPSGSG